MSMQEGWVDQDILKRTKMYPDYIAAKYGYRNFWYPVRMSDDVKEGEPVPITILGENILMNRIDGKIHAIRDRCIHRGVKLSEKIECFTKDTITCWYHGFTYRFDTGNLCDIIAVPNSKLIGKKSLKTYPVKEAKGFVFLYVGDDGKDPLPLEHNVPPGFLDDDFAVRGKWRIVESNWRVGAENGFDSIHIFLHKDANLLRDNDLILPLGMQPSDDSYETGSYFTIHDSDDGPKGLYGHKKGHQVPIFEGKVEGVPVVKGRPDGTKRVPDTISLWVPGILKVEPWPDPELIQFEWYVPVDADRHIYVQAIGKTVASREKELEFEHEYNSRWEEMALDGFNGEDVFARERLQQFYGSDYGWIDEVLCEPDDNIVRWRKLCHGHHRGIQLPQHVR